MYLRSLVNHVPPAFLTQREGWEIFVHSPLAQRLNERAVMIAEKVLLNDNGVEKRHFAIPDLSRLFDLDAEELNHAFEREAPKLSTGALSKALEEAGLRAEELDALFICTCTGYICPGISSHVAEQTGIRADAFLQDIVGLGCGAAIPTLRSASHFLAAHPEANVAVIAVEICSAAFYLDNNPGVIISACLFGDGASASIWSGKGQPGDWKAHAFNSLHLPASRQLLRFENRNGKLRNRLHRTVPEKAGEAVKQLCDAAHLEADRRIVAHSGGRDVIESLEKHLRRNRLDETRHVLRNYGNMSSPSVLFALERCLQTHNGDCPDLWLTSFGAGFAAHSMQLSKTA